MLEVLSLLPIKWSIRVQEKGEVDMERQAKRRAPLALFKTTVRWLNYFPHP